MDITSKIQKFFDYIRGLWSDNLSQGVDDENLSIVRREKIIVFLIAFLLALGLWFLVNMSRSYNLDVKMPIQLGNIPEDKALASNLPESATVSLQGEGWKLISLYHNPPEIFLNVTRDQVNLYEQVREQLNATPTVTVLKVTPVMANVKLEDKVSKKVPVFSNIDVSFRDQFNFLTPPELSPDSVEIYGAPGQLENIDSISTKKFALNQVNADISRSVPLIKPNHLVEISNEEVQYAARVAEFTEGESSVEVKARNVPDSKKVTFSPPTVTIRYHVPIQQYKQISQQKPFTAYVTYEEISQDSTGYIEPHIEVTNKELNIKVRSFQPDKLSYYHVLGGN